MIEVSLLLHTACTESYLFNWNERVLFVLNGHSWHFPVQTECTSWEKENNATILNYDLLIHTEIVFSDFTV